ncbi:hypothetical protein GIB67_024697, partial [Kingdonia uniflora]
MRLGLRAIGFNIIASAFLALEIPWGMSYPTQPKRLWTIDFSSNGWCGAGYLPLYCPYILTMFMESRMEVLLVLMIPKEGKVNESLLVWQIPPCDKYAHTVPDKLTLKEIWDLTEGNRSTFDHFGWIASKGEWFLTYALARDEEVFLPKEAVR